VQGRELARRMDDDHISTYAGNIAFHLALAFLPFLFIIGGVLSAIDQIFNLELTRIIIDALQDDAPAGAAELVGPEVESALRSQPFGIFSVGVVGTIWAATTAVSTLIMGLDQAYQVRERRSAWRRRIVSLVLVASLSVLVLAGFILMVFGGRLGSWIAGWADLGGSWTYLWPVLRTLASAMILGLALAVLYWLAPNTDLPFQLITPGSIFATVGWLVVTAGFAFYANNFGRFNAIYGSIGAAIVLLVWFYVTAYIFLLGGEINALWLKINST
jgi:membrane protein